MKLFKDVFSWIGTLLIAVVFAVLINAFAFQPTKVMGHSMDPTLHDQEYILVSKLSHTFNKMPEYGDIVIIDSRVDQQHTFLEDITENPIINLLSSSENPEANQDYWVKRVIGKPGDVLEFKEHKVFRNGLALNESYIKETMLYTSTKKVVVPPNSIFVMGDNRNNSKDSRFIGSVPLDHVMGKKVF